MIPFLLDKDFDFASFYEANDENFFDFNDLDFYVQKLNPIFPKTNGIGVLADATECIASHEINGIDEIELQYPVNGELFNKIELRSIIVAKVDRVRGNQPYRIYRITKPIRGLIKIYARHLVYDLSGIVVRPYSANNLEDALKALKTQAMTNNPFRFSTSKIAVGDFIVSKPMSAWDIMGEKDGGILDIFGGEYTFDGFDISISNQIGTNRGVSVRYGVNMTDFEQDANCANCYTGVVVFWAKDETIVFSDVVMAQGTYEYTNVLTVDFSNEFDDPPSKEALEELANVYIQSNNIGVPEVSWSVNFVPLDMTEEYKEIAGLEAVSLGDTVKVIFEKLNVNTSARAVSIKWNVLKDKYEEITLGSFKNSLANTISGQAKTIATLPSTEEVSDMIYDLSGGIISDWIKTNKISASQIEGGSLDLGKELNQAGIIRIYDEQNAFIGSMFNAGMWWGKGDHSSLQNQNGFFIRKNVNGAIKRLVFIGRSIDYPDGSAYGLVQLLSVDSEGNSVIRAYINGDGSFHGHALKIYDFDNNNERVNNATIDKDGTAHFKRLFVNGHEIT